MAILEEIKAGDGRAKKAPAFYGEKADTLRDEMAASMAALLPAAWAVSHKTTIQHERVPGSSAFRPFTYAPASEAKGAEKRGRKKRACEARNRRRLVGWWEKRAASEEREKGCQRAGGRSTPETGLVGKVGELANSLLP